MLPIITDIWVNWVDGEDKRNRIPEFFEWSKDDNISNFVEMPVLKVEPEFYNFVEEECEELPKHVLKLIEGLARTVNPKTNRVRMFDYGAVITDGERTLAIYTEGTKKPTLKSRLIPKQEGIVLRLVKDRDPEEVDWEIPEEEQKRSSEDTGITEYILSVDPNDTLGLTRRERELREILIESVFQLSCSDNDKEIMYWYVEMFPEKYGAHRELSRNDMLKEIVTVAKTGWSNVHIEFGNNLVKYYDDNREEWEELVNKGKEKQRV